MFDRIEGILDFHKQMVELIGNRIKYYATETMENAKQIKDETFGLIPFWLSKSKRKRGIYMLTLESGSEANVPSDTAFYFYANEEIKIKGGVIRILLPINFFGEEYGLYSELAGNLVKNLDFEFGHGGYSLNWDPNGDLAFDAQDRFPFIAKRFIGIDIPDNDATLFALTDAKTSGFKCVNWITLLGKLLAKQAGPVTELKKKLSKLCTIRELETGLMIVAGSKPMIGDTNRREHPKAYHEVGRLFANFRLKQHPEFVGAHPSDPNHDISDEWLARFDE